MNFCTWGPRKVFCFLGSPSAGLTCLQHSLHPQRKAVSLLDQQTLTILTVNTQVMCQPGQGQYKKKYTRDDSVNVLRKPPVDDHGGCGHKSRLGRQVPLGGEPIDLEPSTSSQCRPVMTLGVHIGLGGGSSKSASTIAEQGACVGSMVREDTICTLQCLLCTANNLNHRLWVPHSAIVDAD